MKVIMAAAGTGGHINPAIAIANKIKETEPNSQITFIGTSRGLETDLVPRAGYPLKTIEAYGLSKNIKETIKTIQGIKQAERIIKEIKPDVVVGTGGYICGPVLIAAKKQHIPSLLHESNAFPGKAVKLLSQKTNTVLLGFADAKDKLPKANNIVVTGNPTKIKKLVLTDHVKKEWKQKQGLNPDLPVLLAFGGSQGAKAINDSLIGIIKRQLNKQYQIMWAAGPTQYPIIKEILGKENINMEHLPNTKIVPYIYNMEEVMNMADLIVCRSGAMSITEIAMVGKPAIFIPLPNVSQNHQEYNAKVLQKREAAEIIANADLTSDLLQKTVNSIITKPDVLQKMGKNASKLASTNVEEKIYQEIKKIIKPEK